MSVWRKRLELSFKFYTLLINDFDKEEFTMICNFSEYANKLKSKNILHVQLIYLYVQNTETTIQSEDINAFINKLDNNEPVYISGNEYDAKKVVPFTVYHQKNLKKYSLFSILVNSINQDMFIKYVVAFYILKYHYGDIDPRQIKFVVEFLIDVCTKYIENPSHDNDQVQNKNVIYTSDVK